ncbi:DUF456 domain-containing protein [Natronobeatus ordinarius]|uniref:DUF456 domain-containing protein n=1 Tax=Natronobeatus ordinarius TaxID=2963433 RepID=UPI0020CF3A88|nr:DUF456 domain-containing protein [Natronobeatus ordinarius]
MSDRSDELTADREPASTDDLLEETERLLSGEGSSGPDEASASELEDAQATPETEAARSSAKAGSRLGSLRSRLGSLGSRATPSKYFSPKAFLALTLAVVAGLFVGNLLVPVGGPVGGLLGAFVVAFVLGLVTSKRRYLEVSVAGAAVGSVAALLDFVITAIAVGSSVTRLVAFGAAAGLVVCVAGYYFGRDLRDGLSREV